MSSIPSTTEHQAGHRNRRISPRERYRELVYVDLGRNNGGMLLNVSEGGICFQAIQPLLQDEPIQVEFMLPGIGDPIEALGRIVWLNDAGTCGGLHFVNLSSTARHTLAQGLALCNPSGTLEMEISLEPSAPATSLQSPSPTIQAVDTQVVGPSPIADGESGPSQTALLNSQVVTWADQFGAPTSAALPSPRTSVLTREEALLPVAPPTRLRKREPARLRPAESPPAEKTSRTNFRSSPVTFIVACGCFVLLATIAVLVFFHSRLSRAAPLPTNATQVQTASGSQPAAQPSATGAPAQTFEIEVVDSNNKRWALAPETQTSSGDRSANTPRRVQPNISGTSALKAETKTQGWRPSALSVPQRSTVSGAEGKDGTISWPSPAASPLPLVSRPPSALVDPRGVLPKAPDSTLAQQSLAASAGNQPSVLVKRVEPIYSTQAKLLHLEGPVQVSAVIGQDGTPRNLKLVSGNTILGQLALNAVQQWRYKPALLHGVPIEQPAVITVIFRFVD